MSPEARNRISGVINSGVAGRNREDFPDFATRAGEPDIIRLIDRAAVLEGADREDRLKAAANSRDTQNRSGFLAEAAAASDDERNAFVTMFDNLSFENQQRFLSNCRISSGSRET